MTRLTETIVDTYGRWMAQFYESWIVDNEDDFNKEFQKYTCKSVTLAKNDANIAAGKPFDIISSSFGLHHI